MKFFPNIFLFFLLITQIHYPQWTNQNPVPEANDLWSVFFIDDSTGWIVGSGGFIKKTTNAGVDWIKQNSSTTSTLRSVQFVDQNTGWICGESGLILKSTDGGTTWDSLTSGTTQHLSDIYFYDADTGYVVGYGGTILKTTNSGSFWISLSSGTTNDLYSMDFVDAFIGYAAGVVNDTSSVIKTTDGGTSWIDKSGGFPVTSGNCLAVDFVNTNVGFIGRDGSLLKTTDGGDSWIQTKSPFQSAYEEIENSKVSSFYPYYGINSIFFKDTNNGWYIKWSGTDNYIYSTTDGGISWEYQRNLWERSLLSVFVSENGTGLAVGGWGLMYCKKDSSSSWSRLLSGHHDNIHTIYFINENIGWAGGTRWGNPYKRIVLKTSNSGKIWKTQIEQGTFDYFRCFYFINDLIGWFAKANNEAPEERVGGGLYRTTDGGDNWIQVQLGGDYSSVFFINQDTGWVTSDYSISIGIYKTTDGGITLDKKSSISSSSIYFLDNNNGWAVGVGGSILKSTDAGETWLGKTSGTTNDLNCVRFYNSGLGMCVGGGSVLVSTDSGENWNTKSGPSLQTINFINPVTVWGYTSEGTLYKTTNFGDTWDPLNVGLGYGQTSFFINEYTGWVGGMSGTMFKYEAEPPPPPTPPIWSNQITIEDAGGTESSQVLTFGQHIDATDSIDVSLGEYELPPPPPTGIFDSRFNLPTSFLISSLKDFRDSSKTEIIWTITFQSGSAGYPITFSWDSTSFPEGTFYLKDRINGSFVNVNMKNQNNFVLTNSIITSLSIIYKGVSSIVDVNDDWNMISVPLFAEDMSLSNLFPTATSLAYKFEGSYVAEDTLVGGKGYWLKFDENQQIQIYGSRMGDTVPLVMGWNLFGAYEKDIPISQITTTPPGIITTYIFGFNGGYYIADTIKSGQGYWVRVTQNGVLNLNGGGFIKQGKEEHFAETEKNWGKIIISDNKGKSITLFATEEKIGSYLYELPPLPPTSVFDARFSNGRMAEDISSEKIIKISSDNYPITIRAEGLDLTVRDIINGTLLNEELKSGEEIRIMNKIISLIIVSGRLTQSLPVSYELYQNFPNPFNPTTKIKFAIPKETRVNLSIFNVLGELISTVVNEEMKPGYYQVEFNGSKLASGLYIYRILAGDPSKNSQNREINQGFVETRKMILIK